MLFLQSKQLSFSNCLNSLFFFFLIRYSRGLGLLPKNSVFNLRNPVFGIPCYILLMLLSSFNSTQKHLLNFLLFLTTTFSLVSLYLLYILAFVLYNFCPVCMLLHATNFTLLALTIYRKRCAKRLTLKKRD